MEVIEIKTKGKIFLTIKNKDGSYIELVTNNKVLLSGRTAMAASLANQTNGDFNFYIVQVSFGSSGTVGGTPRFISDSQTGLFGATTLTKPVIASIDPNVPQMVTFTTTVDFDELVGQTINEMALVMANSNLFSMATFGDINKTSTMSLVWSWRLSML